MCIYIHIYIYTYIHIYIIRICQETLVFITNRFGFIYSELMIELAKGCATSGARVQGDDSWWDGVHCWLFHKQRLHDGSW